MSKNEKIKALTENDLIWLLNDATPENVQLAIEFYAHGGYARYSDIEINMLFENLRG